MALLRHTATVTETTGYGLDRYVVQAPIGIVPKLHAVGPIEEFNLSERAA